MSTNEDDLRERLGLPSEYEKEDRAEEAWVGAVLRQVGWTNEQVRWKKNELKEGFTWDWFNGDDIVGCRVGSCPRSQRLDLEALFRNTNRCSIVPEYRLFRERDPGHESALLFNIFGLGKWVATDIPIVNETLISIPLAVGQQFNLVPFSNFFKHRWDDSHE